MVDHQRRREYAQLLRRFMAGRLTDLEFERQDEEIHARSGVKDNGIDAIWSVIWNMYEDVSPYTMPCLFNYDRKDRREIARLIMFLRSGHEYEFGADEFSPLPSCQSIFFDVLTLGLWSRVVLAIGSKRNRPMPDYWPFASHERYAEALAAPRFLTGRVTPPPEADGVWPPPPRWA